MNRLLIVTTNLDGLVWQIADGSLNLPNSPPHQTFLLFGIPQHFKASNKPNRQ